VNVKFAVHPVAGRMPVSNNECIHHCTTLLYYSLCMLAASACSNDDVCVESTGTTAYIALHWTQSVCLKAVALILICSCIQHALLSTMHAIDCLMIVTLPLHSRIHTLSRKLENRVN
jgi:hypothetical protein